MTHSDASRYYPDFSRVCEGEWENPSLFVMRHRAAQRARAFPDRRP